MLKGTESKSPEINQKAVIAAEHFEKAVGYLAQAVDNVAQGVAAIDPAAWSVVFWVELAAKATELAADAAIKITEKVAHDFPEAKPKSAIPKLKQTEKGTAKDKGVFEAIECFLKAINNLTQAIDEVATGVKIIDPKATNVVNEIEKVDACIRFADDQIAKIVDEISRLFPEEVSTNYLSTLILDDEPQVLTPLQKLRLAQATPKGAEQDTNATPSLSPRGPQ